jgi:iron(III) transport system ATP-binding protein
MSSLKLKNISKSFGDFKALDNIGLEISEGEFFSVVGPSGCGKSTLLRIISGLESPSSGDVFLEGKNITQLPPQKRNIGIVFQNYALFPHMTVYENIAYGLQVKKMEKNMIKKKVNDVIGKVRITDKKDKNVSTLSGGEQQRVSLARVIVTEPGLLLFDEPLSNLDYSLRLEARDEIKRLQRDLGITSVYVTHDQSEALALSDRIAVINKGKIMQVAPPEVVYYSPENKFTAGFIGHSNLFDASEAKYIFGIEIKTDEFISALPEEIIFHKSGDGIAEVKDVLFTGFSTDIDVEVNSRHVKIVIKSSIAGDRIIPGDKVSLELVQNPLRILKDEKP